MTLTYVPYHYAFYSPSPNLNSFTFILLQSSLYNVKTYEEVKITFTLTISNNSFNTLENVFLDFLVCMYTHKHTQGQRNLHMFFQKHLFFFNLETYLIQIPMPVNTFYSILSNGFLIIWFLFYYYKVLVDTSSHTFRTSLG